MTDVTPPTAYDPDERFTDSIPDDGEPESDETFTPPTDEDDGDEEDDE